MIKVKREKLSEYQVSTIVYDFIDDNIDPNSLDETFQSHGINPKRVNVRREEGILKILIDNEFKFSVELKAEKMPKNERMK